VVLLVVTLLVGIGLFASESTRLAVAMSGNERRMTQARYLAEYALLIAQSKLSNGLGESYIQAMTTLPQQGELCTGQGTVANPIMTAPTCAKILYSDIQKELGGDGVVGGAGVNVCDMGTTGPNGNPGSLGLVANTTYTPACDFSIELTDKAPGMAPAGSNLSTSGVMGTQPLRFWYVTASATGWIRLGNPNTPLTPWVAGDPIPAESSTNQLLRARILAGPYF
jgi:hypothetical protein